jgi:methionine synthase I (cobalamin-dependent)
MGTQLMAAGLPPGHIPELWNAEKPEVIKDIHSGYYAAGADAVHTNTFGANPLKLEERGLLEKMDLLNLQGARIAREACPKGKFVAGDIGPTGKMLQPLGDCSPEEMETAFYRQATALLEGGVDFLSIETMFSLQEALAALRGAKGAGQVLVAAGITYSRTKNGFFTMMGESVNECVAALENAGADVIGANCTLGSREMIELTGEIRALTRLPILIQPNAGKPKTRQGVTTYEQSPAEFAQDAGAIRRAGADMLGGCCGTEPAFMKEAAAALLSYSPR